jgi:uncharacterized membrane protein
MRLKVLVGILVFLIILNLATIGTFLYVHFSHGPDGAPGPLNVWPGLGSGPEPGERYSIDKRVRFQVKEREALRTLLNEFRSETDDLRSRAQDLEREAFELMQQDPVPKAVVDSLLKEISLVQYEVSKRAAAKLIEAKKILPPEQQRHFFNAINRTHSMMRGEPGHPGAGRGQKRWRKSPQADSLGQQ